MVNHGIMMMFIRIFFMVMMMMFCCCCSLASCDNDESIDWIHQKIETNNDDDGLDILYDDEDDDEFYSIENSIDHEIDNSDLVFSSSKKEKRNQESISSLLTGPDISNNLIELITRRIPIKCRTEWGVKLPFSLYILDSCARCYHHMPETAFRTGKKFHYLQYGTLIYSKNNNNETIIIGSNETDILSQTFISISMVYKWQQCCIDALICCINFYKRFHLDTVHHPDSADHQMMCPPTWDGWLCWDQYARPGEMLERPCPKHIYWHQRVPPCRGYARKLCNSTGNWYVNTENREWTNYSTCARDDIYARRIQYSLVTNIISMCALIPALLIFSHYRQVSSMSRIRLHKHLFTSLLFHALISALLKWYLLQQQQESTGNHTAAPSQSDAPSYFCWILSILLRYFRSTNYLWMFNEALYLHQLIKHAFTQPAFRPLIVLAYCLPFITTTTYIVARTCFDNNTGIPGTGVPKNFTEESSEFQDQNPVSLMDEIDVQKAFVSLVSSKTEIRQEILQNPNDYPKWLYEKLPAQIHYERLVDDSGLTEINTQPPVTGSSIRNEVITNMDLFEEMPISDITDQCWLMPSNQPWHEWIINGPNLAVLIINCFFLVWLLRVLCLKAAATTMASSSISYGSQRQRRENSIPNENATGSGGSKNNSSLTNHHHQRGGGGGGGDGQVTESNVDRRSSSSINTMMMVSKTSSAPPPAVAASVRSTSSMFQRAFGNSSGGGGSQNQQNHRISSTLFTRASILVSLRAAVLLFPLYGLHYLFIVYRPKIENCFLSETYHYLSLSFDGLQGLAVSIIFCFANTEIRNLLNRTFQRVSHRQRSMTVVLSELPNNNINNNRE